MLSDYTVIANEQHRRLYWAEWEQRFRDLLKNQHHLARGKGRWARKQRRKAKEARLKDWSHG